MLPRFRNNGNLSSSTFCIQLCSKDSMEGQVVALALEGR